MPYLGREGQFGIRERFQYLASNGDTSVSGSDANGVTMTFTDGLYIDVYLNGVKLKDGEDYNTNTANTVAGISAMNANDEIEVITYDAFSVADTVSAADGGTFSGNVTFQGNITVDADASIGDDLTLGSDAAVINLGADSDVTITHNHNTGVTLNNVDIAGLKSINGGQIGGSRNLVYNGDMAIAQRATSSTGVGATSGYFVQDRWRMQLGGSNAVRFTLSQDSETPDGFANSMKLACTTADTDLSNSTSDYVIVEQRFEGFDLQALNKGDADAKALTVSFYVRSPKTGVHTVTLFDTSNTRSISTTYTIASADTFEYHTVTFAGDTSGVIPDDNTQGLALWFWLMASTDYTSGTFNTSWASHLAANACNSSQVNVFDSTNNIFYLTGVQMELGSTASIFQYESYAENLARCQRYYEVIKMNGYARVGNSLNTNDTRGHGFDFKVEKRTNSITMGHSTIGRNSGEFSFTNNAGNYVSTDPDDIGAYLTLTNASIYATSGTNIAGLTNDSISSLYSNGESELNFDAEL